MDGMSLGYLLLIVVSLGLGFITQGYIKSKYKKWNKVANSMGLTGAEAARRMLDAQGLSHVAIDVVAGELSDHFNPKTNIVSLSEGVYNARTVSAVAIACHECGHAAQHAENYAPAKVRGALVPVVNLASTVWMFVLIAGVVLTMLGLIWLAIALYSATILFQVVTLPVEFNASSRALVFIKSYGYSAAEETQGARSVLTAAALTYVAAALISLMQLVYLLGYARR